MFFLCWLNSVEYGQFIGQNSTMDLREGSDPVIKNRNVDSEPPFKPMTAQ